MINYGTTSAGQTYPYYMMPTYQPYTEHQIMQMAGGSGNIGLNHQEVEEVREELRKRRAMKEQQHAYQQQARVNSPDSFVVITDRNENRLFKPMLPVNRYVHEDDHIEWLLGRTRAVQSKLSWAKVA